MINLLSVFAIAVGLAMDSFAVSVSAGTTLVRDKYRTAIILGSIFGFFQGLMPIIGWFFGIYFTGFITDYAHWIAFILLGFIGAKMIEEGISKKSGEEKLIDVKNPYVLLILGIATSIDALAVGLSFAFLKESIIIPAVIIGILTFVMSFAGVYLGDKLGSRAGEYAEIIGGLILILIGLKIVVENVF